MYRRISGIANSPGLGMQPESDFTIEGELAKKAK